MYWASPVILDEKGKTSFLLLGRETNYCFHKFKDILGFRFLDNFPRIALFDG